MRAIERENESARILAENGYDVEQTHQGTTMALEYDLDLSTRIKPMQALEKLASQLTG